MKSSTNERVEKMTTYEQEVKQMRNRQLLTKVFSVLSFSMIMVFVIVVMVYCWDSGMSKNEHYKNSNACIFKSNCKWEVRYGYAYSDKLV